MSQRNDGESPSRNTETPSYETAVSTTGSRATIASNTPSFATAIEEPPNANNPSNDPNRPGGTGSNQPSNPHNYLNYLDLADPRDQRPVLLHPENEPFVVDMGTSGRCLKLQLVPKAPSTGAVPRKRPETRRSYPPSPITVGVGMFQDSIGSFELIPLNEEQARMLSGLCEQRTDRPTNPRYQIPTNPQNQRPANLLNQRPANPQNQRPRNLQNQRTCPRPTENQMLGIAGTIAAMVLVPVVIYFIVECAKSYSN